MSNSLRRRVGTAIVGLPIVAVAIWVGGFPLLAFTALVSLLGLREFNKLATRNAAASFTVGALGGLVLLGIAARGDPLSPIPVIAIVLGASAWHIARAIVQRDGGSNRIAWALTLASVLYPTGLLAFGLAIHGLDSRLASALAEPGNPSTSLDADGLGRDWVIIAVALVFASDTGAFFTGHAIGKHRMAPRISPGKTWEGAAGGLFLTAIASPFFVFVVLQMPISAMVCGGQELVGCGPRLQETALWWSIGVAIAIGIGISILAQVGDLLESWIKRKAGAKEAGSLLPGHGGILDRLDSMVLVLPAVYYGLLWAI
ncbi:MAG: phosphatidate cytidylyltransferase [Chloroflexi bacterium]|nr:phosphatidate cytidylyltransferase [Chloroflexota bacterium]